MDYSGIQIQLWEGAAMAQCTKVTHPHDGGYSRTRLGFKKFDFILYGPPKQWWWSSRVRWTCTMMVIHLWESMRMSYWFSHSFYTKVEGPWGANMCKTLLPCAKFWGKPCLSFKVKQIASTLLLNRPTKKKTTPIASLSNVFNMDKRGMLHFANSQWSNLKHIVRTLSTSTHTAIQYGHQNQGRSNDGSGESKQVVHYCS